MTNPDRIPYDHWINSQLSIARYCGACVINGVKYVVDPRDKSLVKESLFKKDKEGQAALRKAEKEKWMKIQTELDMNP